MLRGHHLAIIQKSQNRMRFTLKLNFWKIVDVGFLSLTNITSSNTIIHLACFSDISRSC